MIYGSLSDKIFCLSYRKINRFLAGGVTIGREAVLRLLQDDALIITVATGKVVEIGLGASSIYIVYIWTQSRLLFV